MTKEDIQKQRVRKRVSPPPGGVRVFIDAGSTRKDNGVWTVVCGRAGIINNDPAIGLAKDIADALDPTKASGKCRSLVDMSPEEQTKMLALYEAKKL